MSFYQQSLKLILLLKVYGVFLLPFAVAYADQEIRKWEMSGNVQKL